MDFNELVAKVANTEGKKLQEHIGNVRETLSIISDLIFADIDVFTTLYKNGKRRAAEEKPNG